MQFTVYILYSVIHTKHYTGFTSNLEQRLLSHNELGKAFTSKFRPWKLIYTKQFNSKGEALTHERWLKTGAGETLLKRYHTEHRIDIRRGGRQFKFCFPILSL